MAMYFVWYFEYRIENLWFTYNLRVSSWFLFGRLFNPIFCLTLLKENKAHGAYSKLDLLQMRVFDTHILFKTNKILTQIL